MSDAQESLPLGRDLSDWRLRKSTEQLLLRLSDHSQGLGLWDEISEDRADALVHVTDEGTLLHIECYDDPTTDQRLYPHVIREWADSLVDVLSEFNMLLPGESLKVSEHPEATDSDGNLRSAWWIEFLLRDDWQTAVISH